jgi:hypothetical protein
MMMTTFNHNSDLSTIGVNSEYQRSESKINILSRHRIDNYTAIRPSKKKKDIAEPENVCQPPSENA